MKRPQITQEQFMDVLDKCYGAAVNGLPGSKSCEDLASEYLTKYHTLDLAAKKFISFQVAKCSTSGFVTSLGGIITLPVSVPANIASVLYVQLRMIATLASMNEYDTNSDEVQTLIYMCLVNSSVAELCRNTGITIANKTTTSLLKKVPGTVLTAINRKVGFRLFTKFGEKGAINLVKVVPVAGGVVGAGVDGFSSTMIARKAYKMFILNEPE